MGRGLLEQYRRLVGKGMVVAGDNVYCPWAVFQYLLFVAEIFILELNDPFVERYNGFCVTARLVDYLLIEDFGEITGIEVVANILNETKHTLLSIYYLQLITQLTQ